MSLTYGDMFAGYDGLGMGVRSVLGGNSRWFAEFDKAPSKILAHHYPDVPNLGDVTKIDWRDVEPVDVITGGTPCQDLSHAGKRAGMTEGTRSNLWVQMREAINVLRPRLVVWENVRGALSAGAASDLEPCPGCVGDPRDGRVVLRALGRVVGDLAELGYVGSWYGLRAADVSAPHGRFRVFLFAVPADAAGDPGWLLNGDGRAAADADGAGDGLLSGIRRPPRRGEVESGAVPHGSGGPSGPDRDLTLLPTPRSAEADHSGRVATPKPGQQVGLAETVNAMSLLPTPVADNSRGLPSSGTDYASLPNAVVSLLPTPTTTQRGTDANLDTREGARANLHNEVANLLPTPRATDGTKGGPNQRGSSGDLMLPSAVNLLPTPMVGSTNPAAHGQISGDYRAKMADALDRWGDYAPAIARWEHVIGRPAPEPTEPGKSGPRLSARFVEFLMGLPDGHVTSPEIGLTRNQQLKALGNGVVWQQCAAATRTFIDDLAKEPAA